MERVLLVFGGESYEHDISIVTASQIFNKTRLKEIELIPLYVSKTNRYYIYNCENFIIKDFSDFCEQKHNKKFKEVVFVFGEKGKLFYKSRFGLRECLKSNIAIFACHGGMGENGQLVSFFEQMGIFSSAGSCDGLAVTMNKLLFKNIMKGAKLPVVSGFFINKKDYDLCIEKIDKRLSYLKFPVVIKPCSGGSSIGLFVAKDIKEFNDKILSAFEFDECVIVERFISGAREFNIAILGDSNNYLISAIDEPIKISEVLSFEDKYFSGDKMKDGSSKLEMSMSSQKRKFPADIPEDLSQKIKLIAKDVFLLLNLSGVVRIDFLYDEKTNKIYICEVNSIPGSLAFYFFERGKVLINDFVEKLIDLAQSKLENQSKIKIDFATQILN